MIGREIDIWAPPRSPNVIVLEDHDDTLRCICQVLHDRGMRIYHAKNLEDFEKGLQSDDFDVGSVDWDIGGVYQGPEALGQLNEYEADAGKVVYTVHANQEFVVQTAINEGADFVLEKLGENFEEYLSTVENAARLGMCRRIASHLRKIGRWSKEVKLQLKCIRLNEGPNKLWCSLDETIEAEIFEEAREAVIESALAGEESELMELLKSRGWWREFDLNYYAELPQEGKLAQLVEYVGGTAEVVAQILGVETNYAEVLLKGDERTLLENPEIADEADKLLSVLAYILRLSGYEPELMPRLWVIQGMFEKSLTVPPWDKLGFSNYLKINRVNGLNEALFWIRRH